MIQRVSVKSNKNLYKLRILQDAEILEIAVKITPRFQSKIEMSQRIHGEIKFPIQSTRIHNGIQWIPIRLGDLSPDFGHGVTTGEHNVFRSQEFRQNKRGGVAGAQSAYRFSANDTFSNVHTY